MVPELNPSTFYQAIEYWLAVASGVRKLDEISVRPIYQQLDLISGGKATIYQKQLSYIGFESFRSKPQFEAFLARSECLIEMLHDRDLQIRWAGFGWIQLSQDSLGLVKPRSIIVKSAAKCPLQNNAERFDLDTFETYVKEKLSPEEINAIASNVAPGIFKH